MEGPNIVFESRISELEAHLTQMKIELKKSQEEASIYKSKLISGDFSDRSTSLDLEPLQRQVENLRRYFTQKFSNINYRKLKTISFCKIYREKDELTEKVSKLQNNLSDIRDRESDASHKLKRSKEAVDQAHFDKSQVQSDPVTNMVLLHSISNKFSTQNLHTERDGSAPTER